MEGLDLRHVTGSSHGPLDVETVREDAHGWLRAAEYRQTHRPEDTAVNWASVLPAAGELMG